jgi:hypothetical protein
MRGRRNDDVNGPGAPRSKSLYPQRVILQAEAEKAVTVSKRTVYETPDTPSAEKRFYAQATVSEAVSKVLSQKPPGVTGSETLPEKRYSAARVRYFPAK